MVGRWVGFVVSGAGKSDRLRRGAASGPTSGPTTEWAYILGSSKQGLTRKQGYNETHNEEACRRPVGVVDKARPWRI